MLSPNEKYAALVAAAGYLPLTLTGEDYLELLPVAWRQINDYGIRIDYRTYDCPGLGPWRRQHSGIDRPARAVGGPLRPLRPGPGVRPDPGRLGHRAVDAPADDLRAVRRLHLAARPEAGRGARTDDTNETEVARVLDDLLTRAQAGPADKATARVAARTRVAAAAHRPPPREEPAPADRRQRR